MDEDGKVKEWAMVELQGTLETRHPVPVSGKFIGDLHFTHKVLRYQTYLYLSNTRLTLPSLCNVV